MQRQESETKRRVQRSSGSLPPTVLHLDAGPKMSRSMSTSSTLSSGPLSPTSPTMKDLEGLRSSNLKELNYRLVTYVEKVRMLHQATDVLDSISRKSQSEGTSILEMKAQYETELTDWKAKYEEVLSLLNKAKIDGNNLKQDNKQLNSSLSEKAAMVRERDNALASMEAEINELFSKLNILQSEKGRIGERELILRKENDKLRIDLDTSKKVLDAERLRSSDLEARIRGMEKDLKFKIQIVEKELMEEKKKNSIDLSSIDLKLKNEYEQRLKAELKRLRGMYEEHTEKARKEYMNVHSKKLGELQEHLNRERSSNNSAAFELKDVLGRMNEYKRIIAELEQSQLELSQNVKGLDQNLKEQGAAFRAQLMAKDQEISYLQEQINLGRGEYEALLKLNNDLDLEIEVYRNIIDAELDRLQKTNETNSSMKGIKVSMDSSSESDHDGRSYSRSQSTVQDTTDGRRISRQRVTTTQIRKSSASRF